MTAGIEAVVFDVGRVIAEWDMRCLLRKLYADEGEVEWVFTHVVSEDWHARHDAGEPLAGLVAERKAEFPEHAAALDAYASRFLETVPGLVPGTSELIERLAAQATPLFAITNFPAPFWAEFRAAYPVARHFRDVVVSGEERLVKPDPAIFRLAAARFGHAPGAMLFVDDNPANIASAAALGWQVHHFRDAAALAGDFAARGLLPA